MSATDWYQMSLTPPEVIELRIRLGVIPETDHAQVLVELFDPVTKVQIGMWSQPHRRLDSWSDMLDWATRKGLDVMGELLEPF